MHCFRYPQTPWMLGCWDKIKQISFLVLLQQNHRRFPPFKKAPPAPPVSGTHREGDLVQNPSGYRAMPVTHWGLGASSRNQAYQQYVDQPLLSQWHRQSVRGYDHRRILRVGRDPQGQGWPQEWRSPMGEFPWTPPPPHKPLPRHTASSCGAACKVRHPGIAGADGMLPQQQWTFRACLRSGSTFSLRPLGTTVPSSSPNRFEVCW